MNDRITFAVQRWLAGVLVALTLLGCGESVEEEKPDPPTDMSTLRRSYTSPSATLDTDSMQELLTRYDERLGLISLLGIDGVLVDMLDPLISPDEETQEGELRVRRSPLPFEGEGYFIVDRICNGWGAKPTPDRDANGSMELNVTFSPDEDAGVRIDPVIWGEFNNCKYMVEGGVQVLLPSGTDVNLHVGDEMTPNNFAQEPILMHVVGSFKINEEEFSSGLDFVVNPATSELEYRVEVSTGSLVVIGGFDQISGVRARNGEFVCALGDGQCTNESGDTVSF